MRFRRIHLSSFLSPKATVTLAFLLLFQLATLKNLSYSSSTIQFVPLEDSLAPPDESGFHVGYLNWDMITYSTDQSLEPYRTVYRAYCGGEDGLEAVVRVSDELARRFRHGEPRKEFLYGSYDPAYELYAHLGGAPGHCVTRAGLVSAVMLSVGIPARVLQVIPPDSGGHNILEVWDQSKGWVMFDPTTGTAYGLKADQAGSPNLLSAPAAARADGEVIPLKMGMRADGTGSGGFFSPGFFRGGLLYPEPWLYLRVGPKASHWPFTGGFAQVGSPGWQTGLVHRPLQAGIVANVFGLSFQVAALIHVRARRRSSERVTTGGV